MSQILHLSDTHFGTEQPDVCAALLALSNELRPDLVILSGDITQRATPQQYAAAKRFVEALHCSNTLIIPGNHDIPLFNVFARMFKPYGNYQRAFGQVLAPIFANHDLQVIGVNTTRAWRHKDGEVSTQQIDQVAQQLKQANRQQLSVVVVHQPVFVQQESERGNLLHGHQHAIKAWAEAGADLILSGHIHLAFISNLQNAIEGVARPIWKVSAGTAVSKRTREGKPNSVNVIRYDANNLNACLVDRFDFDATLAQFSLAKRHSLELSK